MSSQVNESPTIEKIVLDQKDTWYGYYLSVKPKSDKIEGVLVLLPGFGQKTEDIFEESTLYKHAYQNNILTIGFAGRMRITADSLVQEKLNTVIHDVIDREKVDPDKFIFGGFSAGGVVALRYTELCYEFPDRFPIKPIGVFMADAPVDLFFSWKMQEENLENNYAKISVDEAKGLKKTFTQLYGGTPSEVPEKFIELSPFSIDPAYGQHEQYLRDVAVRAYHDVDIAWRLVNRNQTAQFDNYVATSELINRLLLLGNKRAEFIQSYQTGYRKNGDRHPHSWSIIDEEECIEWARVLFSN